MTHDVTIIIIYYVYESVSKGTEIHRAFRKYHYDHVQGIG